jgi:hypothetical protein
MDTLVLIYQMNENLEDALKKAGQMIVLNTVG